MSSSSIPSAPLRRRLARGALRMLAAALAAVLALALLAALAWGLRERWLGPVLRHYVRSHSGREMTFERVHLRLAPATFDPTLEFERLRVQNAPWAASREPLIVAGRFGMTFALTSLFQDLPVITRMLLEDAQVDLERQADGRRNWRLSHPEDRGPQRVKVATLDARNSRMHVVQQGPGMILDAQVTPLAQPDTSTGPGQAALTRRLVIQGRYAERDFSVDTAVSDLISFGPDAPPTSLHGSARLGAWRLEARGVAANLHERGDFELDATLALQPPGATWPLPDSLAGLQAARLQAHVKKSADHWTLDDLQGHIGRHTRFAGELAVDAAPTETARRAVHARLRDVVIDLDDLDSAGKPPRAKDASAPNGPAWPTTRFDLSRWRELEADVDLADARFTPAARDLVQSLRGHARLADGVLTLDGVDAGLADGHLVGSATLDTRPAQPTLALALQAHGLQLERLTPKLARSHALAGALEARAALHTQGDSVRALVAGASGSVTAALAAGASLSRRLDARMSLDGGAWLHALFDGDARMPVECAGLTLQLDHGVGTSRDARLETAHAVIVAAGAIDFVHEQVEATLTPARKTGTLLGLDKSIRMSGPWSAVKATLVAPLAVAPGACPRLQGRSPGVVP